MNYTEPRHRMLTAVSKGSIGSFHYSWQWTDDPDRHMLRSEAATLTGLSRAGQIQATGSDSAWRSVSLTEYGTSLLAQWNAQHGSVTS